LAARTPALTIRIGGIDMTELETLFNHVPHPRTLEHRQGRVTSPPKVDDQRVGLNGRLGLLITTSVGTMWAAYLFCLLAFVSLPSAIRSGNSIIIVGQNIQAKASDKRADETFRDAEAILHEAIQIQEHLAAQDRSQQAQLAELKSLVLALQERPLT
jgi:hypothetical protein